MKKLNISIIAILMLFSTIIPNAYAENKLGSLNTQSNSVVNYDLRMVKDTAVHKKIEITNKNNGAKEYVESLYKDGEYKYLADTEDGKYEIKRVSDKVIAINIETGEITSYEIKEAILSDDNSRFGSMVSSNSVIFPRPWGDVVNGSGYSSVSIARANQALIAGILASIMGGPVTGVIMAFALWYYSISAPHAYYHYRHQMRMTNYRCWENRSIYRWYKYHDYSNYLGTEISPVKFGGCR